MVAQPEQEEFSQARQQSLIAEAYSASDGSIQAAVDTLYQLATADKTFIAEKLPEIVRAWCDERIRMHVGAIRLSTWTPPNADPKGKGARLTNAIANSLLDFPLPGGKRLGDATPQEVRAGAAMYRMQADDMAWKARWLEKVADAAGRKRTISAALSESDLRKLQEQTNA